MFTVQKVLVKENIVFLIKCSKGIGKRKYCIFNKMFKRYW